MTKPEFRKILVEKGIESALLDDLVHEAASSLASNANNGGMEAQIEFLTNTCEWSYEDILSRL